MNNISDKEAMREKFEKWFDSIREYYPSKSTYDLIEMGFNAGFEVSDERYQEVEVTKSGALYFKHKGLFKAMNPNTPLFTRKG